MAIANITNNILTDSGVATTSLLPLAGGTLTGALVINPTNTLTIGLDVASNTTRFRSDNLEGFKRQLEITMGSGTLVQLVAKGYLANYGTDMAFYTATTGGVNASPGIYITGTNNRVGIKTGTPAYDLDVTGTFGVSSAATFTGDINMNGGEFNSTGRILFDAGAGHGFLFRCDNLAVTAISIASNGQIASVPVYNNTTANAANMHIFSDGSITRSTSSLRFKTNVETLDNNISESIYKMRPIWYRSLCEKDKKDWSWYGFAAEELAILEPRLVHWAYKKEDYFTNKETSEQELKEGAELIADGVQYERIIVLLVAEMQKMRKELDEELVKNNLK